MARAKEEQLRYALVPGITPSTAKALQDILAMTGEGGGASALKIALQNDLARRELALKEALVAAGVQQGAALALTEQEAVETGYIFAWKGL